MMWWTSYCFPFFWSSSFHLCLSSLCVMMPHFFFFPALSYPVISLSSPFELCLHQLYDEMPHFPSSYSILPVSLFFMYVMMPYSPSHILSIGSLLLSYLSHLSLWLVFTSLASKTGRWDRYDSIREWEKMRHLIIQERQIQVKDEQAQMKE